MILARGLDDSPSECATATAELDSAGGGWWLPSAWACLVRARRATSAAVQVTELVRAADILDGLERRLEAAERVIDAAEIYVELCGLERLTSVDIVADSVTGADGPLTTRELHVASLVADGLTNREIGA